MDAARRVIGDLLQNVSNERRPRKEHASDIEATGLPVYDRDVAENVAVSVAQAEALSEADWLSTIDQLLYDSEFAEDLFTDAATVDEYAASRSYPTSGPPSIVRHQYEYPMELLLPQGMIEPLDAFTVRVPRFESFGDRRVIMTGCALDPDGEGCLFTNTTVPLAITFSTAPGADALVRARPTDEAFLTPGVVQGEVVNGVLLSAQSSFLASVLCTGDQARLRGETRGQVFLPDAAAASGSESESAAAAAAAAPQPQPISPNDPVFVARDMCSFAMILDYAQTADLARPDLEEARKVLFLHHGSEYVLTRKQFDAISMHTHRKWQRAQSYEFLLTVRRLDGHTWQPHETDWKISLSVLFEFCCANH